MRVLVLDGQVNPAVAAVRSLGRAGHRVLVGSSSGWSKAAWSRYSSGSFRYTNAEENAERFTACIAAECEGKTGTLVLPVTEKSVIALSAHRHLLQAAGGLMVMPDHAVMLKACDKAYTTRLASELGVAAPSTCLLRDERSAERIAEHFRLPAVLKARTSVEFRNGSVVPTPRTLYARHPGEFLQAYRRLHDGASDVITQRFIDGDGVVYCMLLCRGELRGEFAYRRIRSVHPAGWGAALRVSVAPGGLRESSLAIIGALDPHWTGLACVEYRVRSDGTPFFLEVNPRAWNSLALAVYAGVDFPRMLAEVAEHGDTSIHPGYPEGVVCRWWLGDLRRLLYVCQGVTESYPGKTPGRAAAFMNFLKPVPHAFHDNFMPDDPLPAIGDWLGAATRVLQRVSRKLISR